MNQQEIKQMIQATFDEIPEFLKSERNAGRGAFQLFQEVSEKLSLGLEDNSTREFVQSVVDQLFDQFDQENGQKRERNNSEGRAYTAKATASTPTFDQLFLIMESDITIPFCSTTDGSLEDAKRLHSEAKERLERWLEENKIFNGVELDASLMGKLKGSGLALIDEEMRQICD